MSGGALRKEEKLMVEVHRRGEGDEWRCAARRMKSGNEGT